MTKAEAKRFLTESRSVIKLGTIDGSGDPNVHPVWYYFDPKETVIYALVGTKTKKARNIARRPLVYFLVDHDRFPYKGVRGKGEARRLTGKAEVKVTAEKMLARYIRRDHPMHKYFVDSIGKGAYLIVKITPAYFSTWDYGKMPSDSLTAGLD